MSKRNLTLLIILLVILVVITFGVLYFYQSKNKTEDIGGNEGFFSNLWPFGGNKNNQPGNDTPPTDVSGYVPPTQNEKPEVRLKKISSFPVAGFGVFMKERYVDVPSPIETPPPSLPLNKGEEKGGGLTLPPTEFVPFVRYVNKINGNIYQTFGDKIDERKFSSTVIPRVYDAYFGNNGESVVMRYLKEGTNTIESFLGNLPKEYLGADGGINEITGSFLPENVKDLSISPDSSKIFFLNNINDTAVGTILSLATNTKTQVFDSPFTEWLSSWSGNNGVIITTKPSSMVTGHAYEMGTETKNLNKILGTINGLTTLASPDGKKILYGDNSLSLYILNKTTGESKSVIVRTLPEKCTWSETSEVIYCLVPKFINSGSYPDSWYQGEVSFSDDVWRIDGEEGNGTMILDPFLGEIGENIDGIKPVIDKNQNYLFFMNKKDSYLWELKLR